MLRLFCIQWQDSTSSRNTTARRLPLGLPSKNDDSSRASLPVLLPSFTFCDEIDNQDTRIVVELWMDKSIIYYRVTG